MNLTFFYWDIIIIIIIINTMTINLINKGMIILEINNSNNLESKSKFIILTYLLLLLEF